MFSINLHLLCLLTDIDKQVPMTLMLKKGHWHYPLVEQLSQIINTTHTFDISEKQIEEPLFELLLVSRRDMGRTKVIGCVSINIKQWPMERVKRDKVRLSSRAWLDIELSYKYFLLKEDQLSSQLKQIEWMEGEQQFQKLKDTNTRLKGDIQVLETKVNNLRVMIGQQETRRLKWLKRSIEGDDKSAKDKNLKEENARLGIQLERTNITLGTLINLVSSEGDLNTILKMNQFLESQYS